MTGHGQGRSYLRAGVVAPFQVRDGFGPVVAGAVDLVACAMRAAHVLRNTVSLAEVEDEVQEEIIRAWMSGRGLPVSPGAALRAVVRRVVQRVWSDGSGGRRGRLARWRRQLRSHDAHPVACNGDNGAAEVAVLDGVAATAGSVARVEAQVDAGDAIAAAFAGVSGRTKARRAAALAVLAGLIDEADVADAAHMSVAGASSYRRTLTATLAERFRARSPVLVAEVAHETVAKYKRGCRCVRCGRAMAAYYRERRRARGEVLDTRSVIE